VSSSSWVWVLTIKNSRPSRTKEWDYDFFVDFDAKNAKQVANVVEGLRKHTKDVRVIGSDNTGGNDRILFFFFSKKN
jgi:phenylalanine-4-hydroxylase